jgi:CDP-glucose 4,6-dehydratase
MDTGRTMRFYSNKRVLITGHTGFKGAWLSLWLSEFGANVIGFSLKPPSAPFLYESLGLKDNVKSIRGDIRKYGAIEKVIRDYDPEIVFHLAADPILLNGYESPLDTYNINAIGTLNLLEASRKKGNAKAIVNVTTDKVYENTGRLKGYVESDKLGGHDPYSSSKACSELITQAYGDSFFAQSGIGVATARAGNVIGGGDWGKYRLVPDLVRSLTKKESVKIRNPSAIRPWQYVLDVLSGYAKLAEMIYRQPEKYSGAYNFSSGNSVKTVDEIVNAFISEWGTGSVTRCHSDKHEDRILTLDSGKARRELGWKSKVDFEDMIAATVGWYKAYYSRKTDMAEYSKRLLKGYSNL